MGISENSALDLKASFSSFLQCRPPTEPERELRLGVPAGVAIRKLTSISSCSRTSSRITACAYTKDFAHISKFSSEQRLAEFARRYCFEFSNSARRAALTPSVEMTDAVLRAHAERARIIVVGINDTVVAAAPSDRAMRAAGRRRRGRRQRRRRRRRRARRGRPARAEMASAAAAGMHDGLGWVRKYGLLVRLWLGRRLWHGLALAWMVGSKGSAALALDWQHGLQVRQWLGRRLGGLETGKIAYPSECVRYLSGPLIPAGIRKLGTCPYAQSW